MAQRIIYPINEQEVNDGTSEDVPEHETQASPEQIYQDRLDNCRDAYGSDIQQTVWQLMGDIGPEHPFIQEKILYSLCWSSFNAPNYLDDQMIAVGKKRDNRFTNSAQGEIDQVQADRDTDYITRLGEDKIVWVMLQSLFVDMYNDHATSIGRPKYGEKKTYGGPTVNRKVITDLAATYGVIPKTNREAA